MLVYIRKQGTWVDGGSMKELSRLTLVTLNPPAKLCILSPASKELCQLKTKCENHESVRAILDSSHDVQFYLLKKKCFCSPGK